MGLSSRRGLFRERMQKSDRPKRVIKVKAVVKPKAYPQEDDELEYTPKGRGR
jgi:hypothetical protein